MKNIVILILATVLVGGGVYTYKGKQVAESSTISISQLSNITVPSMAQINRMITLSNGKYSENITHIDGIRSAERIDIGLNMASSSYSYGDVDGDGVSDMVATLEYSLGGSGYFSDLFVFINDNGIPKYLTSTPLGDRIQVRKVSIQDKVVTVDIVTQGPGEGMCCGTLQKISQYRLSGNSLQLIYNHDVITKNQVNYDWKTYENGKYSFKIQYPPDYQVMSVGQEGQPLANGTSQIIDIEEPNGNSQLGFIIAELGSDRLGSYFSSAKNISEYLDLIPNTDQKGNVNRKFVKMLNIAGQQAYWYNIYEWSGFKQAYGWTSRLYFQRGNDIYQIGIDNPVGNSISNQILSTLVFTDQLTADEPTPTISSITPSLGPVGTILEIKGSNLAGFEGDRNVWIQNVTTGVRGIAYSKTGSTASLIKLTLQNKYCTKDNSYSGFPCESYLAITPGVYNIYAMPWGKKSNVVNFTVTK